MLNMMGVARRCEQFGEESWPGTSTTRQSVDTILGVLSEVFSVAGRPMGPAVITDNTEVW